MRSVIWGKAGDGVRLVDGLCGSLYPEQKKGKLPLLRALVVCALFSGSQCLWRRSTERAQKGRCRMGRTGEPGWVMMVPVLGGWCPSTGMISVERSCAAVTNYTMVTISAPSKLRIEG